MQRFLLLAIGTVMIIGFLAPEAAAQGYATKPYAALEIYGGLGTTHYFGDVGGKSGKLTGIMAVIDSKGIDLDQTRIAGVMGFRYIRNKTLAFNAQFKPFWLSGSDQRSMFEDLGRVYSFQTAGLDASLSAEVFLANRLTGPAPYISFGYGLIVYNSQYFDQAIDLNDLSRSSWINHNSPVAGGTDMTRWTDLRISGAFVMGFGVRLPSLSRRLAQNVEIRYQYAAKDNLDGYSLGSFPGKSGQYGQIGDSYLVLSYQVIFDLDRTFVYDHRGRINR